MHESPIIIDDGAETEASYWATPRTGDPPNGMGSVNSADNSVSVAVHRQLQEEARTLQLCRAYIRLHDAQRQFATPDQPNEGGFDIRCARTYVQNREAFENFVNHVPPGRVTRASMPRTRNCGRHVYHEMDRHEHSAQCADCLAYVPKRLLDETGSCDRCNLWYLEEDLRYPRYPRGNVDAGSEANVDADIANATEIRLLFSQSVKLLTAFCRYLGRRSA